MLIVDLIIAVLLGYSFFKGLQKGLIVSVVSLIALIAGIYLSLRFSFFIRELLEVHTQWNANTMTIGAFLITFLLVLFLLFTLGKLLTKLVSALALGILNKLGGALFEGTKMLLILSVFLNLFQKINYNNLIVSEEKLNESIFYHPVEQTSQKIFPLMKEWYELAVEKAAESINQSA